MPRPGDGFESDGNGRCRKCGNPRIEFGFMPGKCECGKSKFYVSSPAEVQRRRDKRDPSGAVDGAIT